MPRLYYSRCLPAALLAPARLLNDSDMTFIFMMMDLVAPGLPSLGALAVLCVWAENRRAAAHSLLAAARPSPRLHVSEKDVFLVAAACVAKDPGTVCCKQHACLLQCAFILVVQKCSPYRTRRDKSCARWSGVACKRVAQAT